MSWSSSARWSTPTRITAARYQPASRVPAACPMRWFTKGHHRHSRAMLQDLATWLDTYRPGRQGDLIKERSATRWHGDLANGFANNGPGRTWTRLVSLTGCMPGQQSNRQLMDDAGRSGSCYGSEGWGFESLRARQGNKATFASGGASGSRMDREVQELGTVSVGLGWGSESSRLGQDRS